jgi:hypothetical protein
MTKVEAKLENRGKGTLEFAEGILRFSVERGRFKKKYDIVREIPLTDIDDVRLTGNKLSITWKGVADIFLIKKPDVSAPIFDEVDSALKKQKEVVETEEAIPEAPKDLINLIKAAFEATESLFDILRNLHGRVDWNCVGNMLKRSEEIVRSIPSQNNVTLKVDFTKSESAVKNNRPEEISREAYEVLKSLNDYMNEAVLNHVLPPKTHPNYEDAKKMLLAFYILNDIVIAEIVEDKEISNERNQLAALMEDLAKTTECSFDIDAITKASERLANVKIEENMITENRMLFKQQFASLLTK